MYAASTNQIADILHFNDKYRSGQIYFYAPDFSGAQFYVRARSGAKNKTVAQNQSQCRRLIEKRLETFIFGLFYLNRTCRFHSYCDFIKRFCNEVFAA